MVNSPSIDLRSLDACRACEIRGRLRIEDAQRHQCAIRLFRKSSHRPIVLQIDSEGGDVHAYFQLERMFKRPEAGGGRAPIVTVARMAHSAAAYLLVSGHCAVACRDTHLIFHGIRAQRNRATKVLWRETAFALALQLDRANRKVAKRLSKRIAPRIAASIGPLVRFAASRTLDQPQFLHELVQDISSRLVAAKTRGLLLKARERMMLTLAHSRHAVQVGGRGKREGVAPLEADVLAAVLSHEAGEHAMPWTFTPAAAVEVVLDFLLAREFMRGRIRSSLAGLRQLLQTHLEPKDETPANLAGFDRLPALLESYALAIWCYALTLSQQLLAGEHAVLVEDARSLGLIDSVISASYDDFIRALGREPNDDAP